MDVTPPRERRLLDANIISIRSHQSLGGSFGVFHTLRRGNKNIHIETCSLHLAVHIIGASSKPRLIANHQTLSNQFRSSKIFTIQLFYHFLHFTMLINVDAEHFFFVSVGCGTHARGRLTGSDNEKTVETFLSTVKILRHEIEFGYVKKQQ